nr:DNA replication factor C complex subunit 3 [Cryptomonas curvata]
MILHERYRPRNVRDLVCNDDSVFIIYKIFNKIGVFNMIVFGPSGTGKTSLIFSIYNELISNKNSYELLEIWGLEEYKTKNTKAIIGDFLNNKFSSIVNTKLIIIKNSDFFSFQIQLFLRKYLENISKFYNFWLLCKFITKINNAISSRCVRIVLKKQGFIKQSVRFKEVLDKENLNISLETLEKLIDFSKFNFRLQYKYLVENFIFNSKRKIKSLIIQKKFVNYYDKNFFKDFFFREENFDYLKKILHFKSKSLFAKSFFLHKKKIWFFLNNPIFVFEKF